MRGFVFNPNENNTYSCEFRLDLDYRFLIHSFGKLHITFLIWSIMQFCTLFVTFFGLSIWIHHRKSSKIYDGIWLMLYLIYLTLFLIVPCQQIVKQELPVASAFIILLEQVEFEFQMLKYLIFFLFKLRQLMKTHSFIRENITKISLLTGSF